MDEIKRGTTPTIGVRLNIQNVEVSTIDFLFKQEMDENGEELVKKSYPDEVDYDAATDRYLVPLTESETRLFQERHVFYLDTKITLVGGSIPPTDIVTIEMNPTLFAEEDEEVET